MTSGVVRKKILIMAGGTGGHVYPALAVARVLQRHSLDVVWLGTHPAIHLPTMNHQFGAVALA